MRRLPPLALAVLLSVLAAGPVLATTPKFSKAPRETGMGIDDFASRLAVFNAGEVADLLHARTVTVHDYANSWRDDEGKAIDLLSEDSQSINQLREALMRNPAAVKLLAENRIKVDQVVDIVASGGNVQLYVQ